MTLALTPGDPAGIGPDLVLQLAAEGFEYPVEVLADPDMLRQRAALLNLDIHFQLDAPPQGPLPPGQLAVRPVPLAVAAQPGKLEPANAPALIRALELAVAGCRDGRYAALVTGPLHKGVINDAGIPFSGHTEYLAALSGGHPVMMLACPGLRVALATTHLPLREVADTLSPELVEKVLHILEQDLRQRFAIPKPRILVCGLNPHAGEGGHLGNEEQSWLTPLLERLRAQGMTVRGPLPADTLFHPRYLDRADAVLAMYHDQGLPVLKYKGFGRSVNITLGLPLVRTSVDHGTALELAGSGQADPGSLREALKQAQIMSQTAVIP